PIPLLPSVAIWTVKNRRPVALAEPGNGGQVVDDAGGDQQVARLFLRPIAERHAIMIVEQLRAGDANAADLHAVGRQLTASEIMEGLRRDPVSCQVAVEAV